MIDLALDDDHQELRRVARDLFAARCPITTVRDLEDDPLGYQPALWAEMAQLDWVGLDYPEDVGGAGGTIVDLAMIYMELGRSLAPSPHLASAVVAGRTLLAAGADGPHGALLRRVVTGDAVVVPALMEPSGEYGPAGVALAAAAAGGGFRLDGTKLLVPYAHVADQLLVAARTGGAAGPEGVTLFLVDPTSPGVLTERLPNIATMPLSAVHLQGVEVGAEAVVGTVGAGWALLEPALARAAVLRSAEIAGAGERILEMAVDYAMQRHQFGKPIGAFQAVQYLCTDIAIAMHLTTLYTYEALLQLDAGDAAARAVATAKGYASEASQVMTHQAHEVFAGAGFMLETDLQLYTRRAKHWQFDLGDARHHREAIAALLDA